MNGLRHAIETSVEGHRALLTTLSHDIHAHPELCFEEVRAAGWTSDALAGLGYRVDAGVGGLATAFTATAGSGPFTIAICAEYDALPTIGHACGHNIIAASAVGAAAALAPLADDLGITIRVIGTPAEEGGGGKVKLLEAGVFDGVNAAMMVHPGIRDDSDPRLSALASWNVRYRGREAHAAAAPHLGVNAGDALHLANVAIGLLRQQLQAQDRVHGVTTHGGDAANIIPALTAAHFFVRAPTQARLVEVEELVRRCFDAGALATGCTVEIDEAARYADMVADPRIAAIWARHAAELGRGDASKESATTGAGSTDMGNVSHAVASIHPVIDIGERSATNHQPGFTAACANSRADTAMVHGAQLLALTAADVASDPLLRSELQDAAVNTTSR